MAPPYGPSVDREVIGEGSSLTKLHRAYRHWRNSCSSVAIVGAGGAGCNIVNQFDNIGSCNVLLLDTDAQMPVRPEARHIHLATRHIQDGMGTEEGPEVEEIPSSSLRATQDDCRAIEQALTGAEIAIVVVGLGGDTGRHAAKSTCEVARKLNIATIVFATLPFTFEGHRRRKHAALAQDELASRCDTLIVLPSDSIAASSAQGSLVGLQDSFHASDNALLGGMQSLVNLITVPGLINVDVADVKSILRHGGHAHLATGTGRGPGRALHAAQDAVTCPLLAGQLHGASGAVWSITGPPSLSIGEVQAAAEEISRVLHADANVIFGSSQGSRDTDEVTISLILTGLQDAQKPERLGHFQAALQKPRSRLVETFSRHTHASTLAPSLPTSVPLYLMR